MAVQNDFYTLESLATFAGATGATTVVANGIQHAFDFNPRWLALAVAQGICIGVVSVTHMQAADQSVVAASDYFVAIVNGFLIFATAAGLTSAGATVTGSSATSTEEIRRRSPSRGAGTPSKRGFFSPWF
jgi:hypothetical protein